MRLRSAKIRNYRTLESVDLDFPSSYAAICGPNDSGKTNVVRALRALVRGRPPEPFGFPDEDEGEPRRRVARRNAMMPMEFREGTAMSGVAMDGVAKGSAGSVERRVSSLRGRLAASRAAEDLQQIGRAHV